MIDVTSAASVAGAAMQRVSGPQTQREPARWGTPLGGERHGKWPPPPPRHPAAIATADLTEKPDQSRPLTLKTPDAVSVL